MTDNKKTYIIAGSILALAYVVYRKKVYPTETNIINLLFGGVLFAWVPPPPPPPPIEPKPEPTPIEPPTEQQMAISQPLVQKQSKVPTSTSIAPKKSNMQVINAKAPKIAKAINPMINPANMPVVTPQIPSFSQYGKSK